MKISVQKCPLKFVLYLKDYPLEHRPESSLVKAVAFVYTTFSSSQEYSRERRATSSMTRPSSGTSSLCDSRAATAAQSRSGGNMTQEVPK